MLRNIPELARIGTAKGGITMISHRQGDVYLRAEKAPGKAKRVEPDDRGRTVLGYGEVTGHGHGVGGDVERTFKFKDHVFKPWSTTNMGRSRWSAGIGG